ncbi:twin-arginine translocation signal domain-containing protein, partial [Daejeonella sp.]|uniref:twin-arginine translocation signal domain-containing protein n=1 Tax=Daejeonella sp. TaxID=2805397 RepID=UPI003982FEE1
MSKAKTLSCNCSDTRRTFLKSAGLAGLAFAGLPQIASAITGDNYQEKEILRNKALQNGKAQRITLLHTADIHSQL